MIESDLIQCPITCDIIRHPILVDNRHYELKAFFTWVKQNGYINPISKKSLTTITYDYDLKNELDRFNFSNRHANYEKDEMLNELMNGINPVLQWKQSAYKAATTAFAVVFLYALFSTLFSREKEAQLNGSSLLLCLFASGLIDYFMRASRADRLRFFNTIDNMPTHIIHFINPSRQNDETDENAFSVTHLRT